MTPRSINLLVCSLLIVFAFTRVLAFGPTDALAYQDPQVAAAKAKEQAAIWRLRALSMSVGGMLGASNPQGVNNYTMQLHFSQRSVDEQQARQAIEAAGQQVRQLERKGITDALQVHADLWKAQAEQKAALLRSDAARVAHEETVRKFALGACADTDVTLAEIDQEDAGLTAQHTQLAIEIAKRAATRFGFTAPAEPAVLHFALPDTRVESSPEYVNQQRSLALANAQYKTARRENLPGLGADLTHIGGSTQVIASLSSRLRTADVTLGYPSLYDPSTLLYGAGWQTSVKVEIPLDPAGWSNVRLAKTTTSLAAAQLEHLSQELSTRLAQARSDTVTAEDQLTLAQRRCELQARKLIIADARAKTGALCPLDLLRAQADNADADAKLAAAWKAYLQTTAAYLDLVDGKWAEKR